MSRKSVLLALVLALLLQSLALARTGSSINVLANAEHAVLHWLDENHHHHDDGSYHVEDTDESTHHMLADQLTPSAIPLTPSSVEISSHHDAPIVGPTVRNVRFSVDGLLRPPRLPV